LCRCDRRHNRGDIILVTRAVAQVFPTVHPRCVDTTLEEDRLDGPASRLGRKGIDLVSIQRNGEQSRRRSQDDSVIVRADLLQLQRIGTGQLDCCLGGVENVDRVIEDDGLISDGAQLQVLGIGSVVADGASIGRFTETVSLAGQQLHAAVALDHDHVARDGGYRFCSGFFKQWSGSR